MNDELILKAYQAFNLRDIDAVLPVMHPDVAWANGMDGGYVHGHSGVREYWSRQWSLIDPPVEQLATIPSFNEVRRGSGATEVWSCPI